MMDDSFVDASDGDTTGHYAEWRIGADAAAIASPTFIPQLTDPLTAVAVGGCAQGDGTMMGIAGIDPYSIIAFVQEHTQEYATMIAITLTSWRMRPSRQP